MLFDLSHIISNQTTSPFGKSFYAFYMLTLLSSSSFLVPWCGFCQIDHHHGRCQRPTTSKQTHIYNLYVNENVSSFSMNLVMENVSILSQLQYTSFSLVSFNPLFTFIQLLGDSEQSKKMI